MSIDRILTELLSSPARAGLAGAVAGGLLTSKAGRKLGKRAAELGGLAAIAGLAYTAWRRYEERGGRASAPEAAATPALSRESAVLEAAGFLPPPQQEAFGEPLTRLLLRAMIAAARADGKLDGGERRRLFDRMARLDLGDGDRAELYAELEKPVTLDQLVASVASREQAAEIYAASLLAIEVDTPAERAYLSLLAGRLGLEDELVASLHREAGVPAAAEIGLQPAKLEESRMLETGQPFPDFSLPNQDGVRMSLADFRNKWLVVYTYPKDDTPGCTLEGKSFSAAKPAFDAIGAVVVGLSADDVKSHKSFCDKFAFTVPLLADTRAELLKALGVGQSEFQGTKYWDRVTFLVDPKGVVRKVYPKVKPDGHDQAVLRDLKELQKTA